MHHDTIFLRLVLLTLVCACGSGSPQPDDAVLGGNGGIGGSGLQPGQEAAWVQDLLAERSRKDEEYATSETSPMAGTQYLKSDPADHVVLARRGRAFSLEHEDSGAAVLATTREDGVWIWTAIDPSVFCHRDDEVVSDGSAVDGPAVFSVDDLRLAFYPGEDRVTFIVFDREREEARSFEKLEYYPPDPALAVSAELMPLDEPEAVEMVTTRNLEKTLYRYATVRFTVSGVERELTAYKYTLDGDGSRELFIPFRDATTGRETYGAGRYLEIEEPGESSFVLDFNRAFNPLCAYSPAYNCAVPPRENHLDVPILAGEKTYPH